MKIALISDLHGQKNTLGFIRNIISHDVPDTFIVSGDITTRDETDFFEEIMQIFESAKLDAFVIWGNSDGSNARRVISMSPYNSNLVLRKFGNIKIYGVGETELPEKLDSNAIKDSILITHRPPLTSVLSKVLPNAPKFHVCGHIHSKRTFKQFASTKLIQVPSLTNRSYAIFDPIAEKVDFKTI
jgi:Icc-related predicted phosphoesterase